MTGFPVSASISLRVSPAIRSPRRATCLFASKVFGYVVLEISIVVASANIFRTSSIFFSKQTLSQYLEVTKKMTVEAGRSLASG